MRLYSSEWIMGYIVVFIAGIFAHKWFPAVWKWFADFFRP